MHQGTCPAQTKAGVDCSICRLCWNAERLYNAKRVVRFDPHSGGRRKLEAAVAQLRNE